MAERRVWIGSVGPFLFDDADNLYDETESPIGKQRGVRTDSSIAAAQKPTNDDEVIRMEDVGDGSVVNGDIIDLDYTPANYSPSTTGTEADDTRDLAAHLKGIDDKLGEILDKFSNGWSGTFQTGDGKTATVQDGLITDVS